LERPSGIMVVSRRPEGGKRMPWAPTDDDQEIYYERAGDGGPVLAFAGGFGGVAEV
jgi:hypothetical protein